MSLLFLSLVLCVVLPAPPSAQAFSSHGRTRTPASITALHSTATTITNRRNETGAGTALENAGVWSLDADWLLEDAVPRYTVVSHGITPHRVTFWHQLRHATAALRDVSEDEIEERFRALHRAEAPLLCGPAPPTLTDWWVDEAKHTMGGTTDANGAAVWFYIQSGGRLIDAGPPMMALRYAPGGFVEATDGVIYELGSTAAIAATPDSLMQDLTPGTTGPARDLTMVEAFYKSSPTQFLEDSARHTRKLLLVAITVSSVLSATLAYGIGQGLGQQLPLSSSTAHAAPSSCTLSVRVLPSAAPGQSGTLAAAPRPAPSVQEQRARQELRLIREKKAQTYLAESIQRDEEKLTVLQREETRQEGAALGYY